MSEELSLPRSGSAERVRSRSRSRSPESLRRDRSYDQDRRQVLSRSRSRSPRASISSTHCRPSMEPSANTFDRQRRDRSRSPRASNDGSAFDRRRRDRSRSRDRQFCRSRSPRASNDSSWSPPYRPSTQPRGSSSHELDMRRGRSRSWDRSRSRSPPASSSFRGSAVKKHVWVKAVFIVDSQKWRMEGQGRNIRVYYDEVSSNPLDSLDEIKRVVSESGGRSGCTFDLYIGALPSDDGTPDCAMILLGANSAWMDEFAFRVESEDSVCIYCHEVHKSRIEKSASLASTAKVTLSTSSASVGRRTIFGASSPLVTQATSQGLVKPTKLLTLLATVNGEKYLRSHFDKSKLTVPKGDIHEKHSLSPGDNVSAQYRHEGHYYPAVVKAVHEDGSHVEVEFDNTSEPTPCFQLLNQNGEVLSAASGGLTGVTEVTAKCIAHGCPGLGSSYYVMSPGKVTRSIATAVGDHHTRKHVEPGLTINAGSVRDALSSIIAVGAYSKQNKSSGAEVTEASSSSAGASSSSTGASSSIGSSRSSNASATSSSSTSSVIATSSSSTSSSSSSSSSSSAKVTSFVTFDGVVIKYPPEYLHGIPAHGLHIFEKMTLDERLLDEGSSKAKSTLKVSHKKPAHPSHRGLLHQSVIEIAQLVACEEFVDSAGGNGENVVLMTGDIVTLLKIEAPESKKAQGYGKHITASTSVVVFSLPLGTHFSVGVFFKNISGGVPGGSGSLAFADTLSFPSHRHMAEKLCVWLECLMRTIHGSQSQVSLMEVSSASTAGTMNCGPATIENTKSLLQQGCKIRAGDIVSLTFKRPMKSVRASLKFQLAAMQRAFGKGGRSSQIAAGPDNPTRGPVANGNAKASTTGISATLDVKNSEETLTIEESVKDDDAEDEIRDTEEHDDSKEKAFSMKIMKGMSVKELKGALSGVGKSTSGLKAELVERLGSCETYWDQRGDSEDEKDEPKGASLTGKRVRKPTLKKACADTAPAKRTK